MIHIPALIGIALACGLIIYLVFVKVPQKVKGLEKTEEINAILPGANCGACGQPGCFAYAQALSQQPDLVTKSPCSMTLNDPERVAQLEKALGVTLDAAELSRQAVIHCAGNSERICDYCGAMTCKAAAQILGGYKRCPYACLRLGDCAAVCPQGAIYIDPEKNVAAVDQSRCSGCGLCVAECPHNLIELVPAGTKIVLLCSYQPLRDIPGREKCDSGCIRCRKCLKACEHEAMEWNKEKGIVQIVQEKCTQCHKCLEACERHGLIDVSGAHEEDLIKAK
ncbi:MAG: 4Fe-4S dicluster domain-containing protein [Dehalococcoidia bacterium]